MTLATDVMWKEGVMDSSDNDSPVFKAFIESDEFVPDWEGWEEEPPIVPMPHTPPGLWFATLQEGVPAILGAADGMSVERDFGQMVFDYLSQLLYGEEVREHLRRYDRLFLAVFFTGYMAALGTWTALSQGDEDDWPGDDSEIPF